MYYFYRSLSLLKAAVGYFITVSVKFYNYLAGKVMTGAEKEIERIAKQREKDIERAKHTVAAAERLVDKAKEFAEQDIENAQQKAFKKHVKVAQKLQ